MIKILDECLLSANAYEKFMEQYSNNKEFNKWINEVLPEVWDCLNQQQNNPWHKYGVLEHILRAVEYINIQTKGLQTDKKRLLAYTMFLHDIGKPKCHITRNKDGKIIDSFFNHNVVGEEIAKRVLSKFNFDQNQIKQICMLVYKHDIFMFIKPFKSENPHWKELSYDLLQSEINDLNSVGNGYELMKYLVMVGRADNLAQNEKMTADSLNLLKTIDSMLSKMDKQK